MKYVNQKSDMIHQPHWAIVEFSSVWIPGDERSRSDPGHGYPDRTESVVKYIAFTDEDEWKKEISKRMTGSYSKQDFVAIRATPASIKMETIVDVQ